MQRLVYLPGMTKSYCRDAEREKVLFQFSLEHSLEIFFSLWYVIVENVLAV